MCPKCGRRFTARGRSYIEIDDAVRELVALHLIDVHGES